MNPDPTYFWKRYLESYFKGIIPTRLSYSNDKVLSGITIDMDINIPCDPNTYQPTSIETDYQLVEMAAKEL